jgi:hypothetical protein
MASIEFDVIRDQELDELIIKGYRPLRGLNMVLIILPGVRCTHPGLYAGVRFADL